MEEAFVNLLKEYEGVIYKVCYLYATPSTPMEDLYQDVVLNLWKAYPHFRSECKISTYIYRIALNTCISHLRKKSRAPSTVELTPNMDRADEKDEVQIMLAKLYQMVNCLGKLDRSLVLLYLDNNSYEDMAEVTGLTLTNVATRLNRIKKKLKKMNKEE